LQNFSYRFFQHNYVLALAPYLVQTYTTVPVSNQRLAKKHGILFLLKETSPNNNRVISNSSKKLGQAEPEVTGPVRPLGKLGSGLHGAADFEGPRILHNKNQKNNLWKFINETTLAYF